MEQRRTSYPYLSLSRKIGVSYGLILACVTVHERRILEGEVPREAFKGIKREAYDFMKTYPNTMGWAVVDTWEKEMDRRQAVIREEEVKSWPML